MIRISADTEKCYGVREKGMDGVIIHLIHDDQSFLGGHTITSHRMTQHHVGQLLLDGLLATSVRGIQFQYLIEGTTAEEVKKSEGRRQMECYIGMVK